MNNLTFSSVNIKDTIIKIQKLNLNSNITNLKFIDSTISTSTLPLITIDETVGTFRLN